MLPLPSVLPSMRQLSMEITVQTDAVITAVDVAPIDRIIWHASRELMMCALHRQLLGRLKLRQQLADRRCELSADGFKRATCYAGMEGEGQRKTDVLQRVCT